MVTHSSILAWRIPWTEEPGGLQSMGMQRVGYDWVIKTHVYAHAHTRMSAHREKTPRGHSKRGLFASQGERPHKETNTALTLILDFQPPDLGEN